MNEEQPTTIHERGGRRRNKVKKMLIWFLAAIGILAAAGFVYQAVAAAIDEGAYGPPGQMVEIAGNRRLHMVISGDAKGQPTVILEAGMASFSSNWYWVQEELAQDTRVISYDRAGLGWSDPAPAAHDVYDSAADLHLALEAAGMESPYVMVGHSYGGLVVRAFTDLYPDEVLGMVLVDGSHPDQWAHMPASLNGRLNAALNGLTAWLARLGIVRLFDMAAAIRKGMPERPAGEMKAIFNRPQSWATSSKTLAIWHDMSRPRIDQAHSLGNLPLVVLGVTDQPVYGEILTALQDELPALSTNSTRHIVEGATHEGLISERDHAQVVVGTIRWVLQAVQTGSPLSEIPIVASDPAK